MSCFNSHTFYDIIRLIGTTEVTFCFCQVIAQTKIILAMELPDYKLSGDIFGRLNVRLHCHKNCKLLRS